MSTRLSWDPNDGFVLDLEHVDGDLQVRVVGAPVPADGLARLRESPVALHELEVLFRSQVDWAEAPAQLQQLSVHLVAGPALAIEGRLCYLGGDGGRTLQLNMAQLLKKRLHITGGSLRRRPIVDKARLAATIEHRVWPWVRSGAVRPQIGMVVPLKEAAKAHEALQRRQVTGKVVLVTEACERRA